MIRQRGFTLLELMVAMAIFAMLAVAGWQVFDSVNRARERAQYHADNLAVLQYAYLQLQQDMAQIVAYQAPNTAIDTDNNDNTNNSDTNATAAPPEPFMSVDGARIRFVRFADPDPRYQSSPSLQRIEYVFDDERLIRRQYMDIQGGADSVSLDSVLLDDISAGQWQAYLPETSASFPSPSDASNTVSNATDAPSETMLLPKGIGLSFTYEDMPLAWQWALTPEPLPDANTQTALNTPSSDDASGQNNNSGNTGNSSPGDNRMQNSSGGVPNMPNFAVGQ